MNNSTMYERTQVYTKNVTWARTQFVSRTSLPCYTLSASLLTVTLCVLCVCLLLCVCVIIVIIILKSEYRAAMRYLNYGLTIIFIFLPLSYIVMK